jgi:hypothetical protein
MFLCRHPEETEEPGMTFIKRASAEVFMHHRLLLEERCMK